MGGELSILSVCIGVRGRVLSVSFSVIVCVYKKNNRKYMSKLGSGKTITEENVIACIQEHRESKKQVKNETKKSSITTFFQFFRITFFTNTT
jgi:hypothetical protein